jgi:hypothetical protein
MLVIPRHGELREEDHNFQASLGYIVTPCLRKKKGKRSSTNIIKHIHILWRQTVSMILKDIEKVPFKIRP